MDAPREMDFENIPPASRASNDGRDRAWRTLARLCRRMRWPARRGEALELVLRAAAEASGMERAFLVTRQTAAAPRVAAASPHAEPGPSTTAVRHALAGREPLVCADARADRLLAAGASVRALRLRAVLGVPAPLPTAHSRTRAVLLLDSRGPLGSRTDACTEPLLAFAALAGLLLPASPGAPPAEPVEEREPVGRSRPFLRMVAWVRRIAPYRFPVLIAGESGSGKEGVARALHRASRRAEGPFLAINCAAFPETLLESELFGAVRGAYTGSDRDRPGLFRRAHGGTLLLDEIGDMPLAMQAKLLRVLQEQRVRPVGGEREVEVDVRILAATHRDLGEEVRRGRFRADLFHRIAVVDVRVPPLRERAADLPLLVDHLADRLTRSYGLPPARLDQDAVARLAAHDWPGNVRELQAVLTRGMLRARRGRVRAADLDLPATRSDAPPRPADSAVPPLERSMIECALRGCDGNLSRAAALIGWSRQKLYRRMSALGVPRAGGTGSRGPRYPVEPPEPEGRMTSSDSSTFQ